MLDLFYNMTDFQVFLLFSLVAIIISTLLVFVLRRFGYLRLWYRDDTALGNVSSLIGIIYGVLAGLTALYLINNISYTADAVQREANAVANIYRDSSWIKQPAKEMMQTQIKNYLHEVIFVEWPLMQHGKTLNTDGDHIITMLSDELIQYGRLEPTEGLIVKDMFDEIKTLYNARHQRIHMSFSQLNMEIWIVILIGSLLIIAINFFLKMSFYLHILAVGATALMVSAMFFLLVTLDRPFQGEFVVQPDALQSILATIEKPQR